MTKIVILFFAVLGLTLGFPEKPAPYAPKGWKPQGARLELPRQYGPPKSLPGDIELTTVSNEYFPPTTDVPTDDEEDILRVQGLPSAASISEYRKYQQNEAANFRQQNKAANLQQRNQPAVVQQRPQAARIQFAPAPAFASQPLLLAPVFAPSFAPVSGQLQEQKFGQQVQGLNNPKNDAQQVPVQGYGPPQTNLPGERNNEAEVPQNDVSEKPQQDYDENENQDESDEPVIAVSNADSTGDPQQGQLGQYYILLPDNSLQKVRFATKQTDEDRQLNGFSAQLRWSFCSTFAIMTFWFPTDIHQLKRSKILSSAMTSKASSCDCSSKHITSH